MFFIGLGDGARQDIDAVGEVRTSNFNAVSAAGAAMIEEKSIGNELKPSEPTRSQGKKQNHLIWAQHVTDPHFTPLKTPHFGLRRCCHFSERVPNT